MDTVCCEDLFSATLECIMKPLVDSLRLIARRRDSRMVIIVSTVFLLLLLLVVQNGKSTSDVMGLHSLSLYRRLTLSLSIFLDIHSNFTTGSLILATLGSFLGGINISLAYTYIKIRGDFILKSGLYSGVGLLFAFFGIGCAACGTAFLSVQHG